MQVLVTGAAGFIGRRMVSFLKECGYGVFGVDSFDPRCGSIGVSDVEDVNVSDRDDLEIFLGYRPNIVAIIHLAAYGRNLTCQQYPSAAWHNNVTGTENVLSVAEQFGIKRVVVCSSNIVLSDQPTVYKTTKQAVESLVTMYAHLGLGVTGLRPSNIYGPGQSKTEFQPCAFAGMDESYKNFGHFLVSGNGTQTRDWVHVDDVCRAFELALRWSPKTFGNIYDVATGVQTSINDIANMLRVPVKYVDARPGDAQALLSNPKFTKSMTGFETHIKLEDRIWDAFPSVPRP